MKTNLREVERADAETCGQICFEAFRTIAEAHAFPPDLPNSEVAIGLITALIDNPGFFGVVAERDGKIVGSNFLDERSTIAGIGPITVLPGVQDRALGRDLMLAVMDRARTKSFPGIRLLQVAYHNRSLCLYVKLGFNVREPIGVLQGEPLRERHAGFQVRPATPADTAACNQLCMQVHGHDRAGEFADALDRGEAIVVMSDNRIVGYSTGLAFFGHSIAESNAAMMAMISLAETFPGPGILVPLRNHQLFRWCLEKQLRLVQVMNLMTIGLYNTPDGSYLPSVLY